MDRTQNGIIISLNGALIVDNNIYVGWNKKKISDNLYKHETTD